MAETQSDLENLTKSFIREYATPKRQAYILRDLCYARVNIIQISNSACLNEKILKRLGITDPSIVISYDVVNSDGVPGITSNYFPSSYRGINVAYVSDPEGRFIPAAEPEPKLKRKILGYHRPRGPRLPAYKRD